LNTFVFECSTAKNWVETLIEAVAETNDELMEKYLGDEEISVEELKNAIRHNYSVKH
jgi:translation elongation factor EF-G